MGFGDSLLAAGQAKLEHRRTGDKISIGDGKQVHWFCLYDQIPYLSREPARWLIDHPGKRGYYKSFGDQIVWDFDYRAEPAELEAPVEREDFVLIEPNVKHGAAPGKRWPLERWQEVVTRIDACFVQPQYGAPLLRKVRTEKTSRKSIVDLMRRARFYVGSEGFLHHLAAATRTPAVVLFGGFSPPQVLGYSFHRNIAHGEPTGLRRETTEAVKGILATTVDEVVENVEALFD